MIYFEKTDAGSEWAKFFLSRDEFARDEPYWSSSWECVEYHDLIDGTEATWVRNGGYESHLGERNSIEQKVHTPERDYFYMVGTNEIDTPLYDKSCFPLAAFDGPWDEHSFVYPRSDCHYAYSMDAVTGEYT